MINQIEEQKAFLPLRLGLEMQCRGRNVVLCEGFQSGIVCSLYPPLLKVVNVDTG
jgi:hypothetical protein